MDIEQVVAEKIAAHTRETTFTPETRLGEELELTAVDLVQIIMAVEKELEIQTDEVDYDDMLTMNVSQLVSFIKNFVQ